MTIVCEWEVAFLPWYEGQSDPRKDFDRKAEDPIECQICNSELEWKSVDEAYCPGCKRRVPAGTETANHVFAKNYTLTVRK